MKDRLTPERCLPVDAARALAVGRMQLPALGGPVVVRVTPEDVLDLSALAPTMRDLLDLEDPAQAVRGLSDAPRIASTREVLANSAESTRNPALPWFLAPCDLQAVKAAGVTFVSSMLERVIEEQARGDPAKAERVRAAVVGIIGENLRSVRPGSPEAMRLKEALIAQGVWSQYLEVGIGPDAEIFTKSQPMSSVGVGADIGCALVKISASGPMPTSRYCDHSPSAISTSLMRAASVDPGRTLRRLSPITSTILLRTPSALPGSPRACSSITRSSMLATNVTQAALIAWRSQGARSHGSACLRRSAAELASASASDPIRGSGRMPISRTTPSRSKSSVDVGAIAERSSSASP